MSRATLKAVLAAAFTAGAVLVWTQPAAALDVRSRYERNRTHLVDRLPMSLQLTLRGYAVQSPTRFLNAFESMVWYNQDLGPLLAEEARYYRPDLTPQIDEIMLQIFPPPTLQDSATERVMRAYPCRQYNPALDPPPVAGPPYADNPCATGYR